MSKKYQCRICAKVYEKEEYLLKHIKCSHQIDDDDPKKYINIFNPNNVPDINKDNIDVIVERVLDVLTDPKNDRFTDEQIEKIIKPKTVLDCKNDLIINLDNMQISLFSMAENMRKYADKIDMLVGVAKYVRDELRYNLHEK
jgi:hypothetical protein